MDASIGWCMLGGPYGDQYRDQNFLIYVNELTKDL